MAQPLISVVIPTRDRCASLGRLLDSLGAQGLSPAGWEVIVVDDGSSDATPEVRARRWPFTLRYWRQRPQGATEARNQGARLARGALLCFMDDDVSAAPGAIVALTALLLAQPRVVALAAIEDRGEGEAGPFARAMRGAVPEPRPLRWIEPRPATFCNTQLLAVRRADFFALGMFQDPTGGWPNWDDVDFGVRAAEAGFRLLRCGAAPALHWDHALSDVTVAAARWGRASHAAARLFERHPALEGALPMFRDKGPIRWRDDGWRLMLRKGLRRLSATPPMLWLLARLMRGAERQPVAMLRAPLYRWFIGAAICRGYRAGLRARRAVLEGVLPE